MSRTNIDTGIDSDHLLAWEEDGVAVLTLTPAPLGGTSDPRR